MGREGAEARGGEAQGHRGRGAQRLGCEAAQGHKGAATRCATEGGGRAGAGCVWQRTQGQEECEPEIPVGLLSDGLERWTAL